MLMLPGYWPDTYWSDRYWMADYWPEYGTAYVPTDVGGWSSYPARWELPTRPLLDDEELMVLL
jgi:hypothetical protein